MSPLVNQRLRISPPHTPRTRRQARPVHVARARTDTEHPQPQPGLSGARGARWGRRPASPAPSSGEQASRSSFFPPLLHVSADRGLALLCCTLLAVRVIGDGREWGCWQPRGGAVPVFARRFGGVQCLLDFWMVESCGEGVSMYGIIFSPSAAIWFVGLAHNSTTQSG